MRLWTWQSKGFSLADSSQHVDNIQHSFFLQEIEKIDPQEARLHEEAYRRVFQRVGTDQLIWCFKDLDKALGISTETWDTHDCVLWEVDVPEDKIRWYCPVAWERLRTGSVRMSGFIQQLHRSLTIPVSERADSFRSAFNSYWNGKTDNEVLDSLFLKRSPAHLNSSRSTRTTCPEAIIEHPVDNLGGTIVKNPLDPGTGRWWGSPKRAGTVSELNTNGLPCPSCQAQTHMFN